MVFVDKDAWGPGTGINFPCLLAKSALECYSRSRARYDKYRSTSSRLPYGLSMGKFPKMILVATSITQGEIDMAKANGFVETIIIKPLRASMVAACLQQVLGVENGRERGRETRGGGSLQNLLSGKRILVVDDNPVNRRVAAGALNKYGAQVECVDSGRVAIQKLKPPHNFDACFMDVQMPEMDGYVI